MEWLLQHKGLIIILVIIAVIGILLYMINFFKRKAKRTFNRVINRTVNGVAKQALGGINLDDVSQLMSVAKEVSQEPQEKSISGATNLYLPKITKDFADFHNAEAISAVKIFINEFLEIRYNEKDKFEHSNVEEGLEELIEQSSRRGNVYDINIHKIAISAYNKTNEYATIVYQASVGYNINENKQEERYTIEYTLKLSENGIADKILKCDNCGATIDSTAIENCPYCDARIIRDTRMSWKFTSIAYDNKPR